MKKNSRDFFSKKPQIFHHLYDLKFGFPCLQPIATTRLAPLSSQKLGNENRIENTKNGQKNLKNSQNEIPKIELKIDWTAIRKHEAKEKINRLELIKVKQQHTVQIPNPENFRVRFRVSISSFDFELQN